VESELHDITILGGGPTGLFAAYYAGLRQCRTKIIDSLAELGGQLTALYPEKYIYDVAGFPKVLAQDLVKGLVDQAMQYRPTVCLEETALRLETGPVLTLTTQKAVHRTKTLIICAGVGAFAPRRLDVPGARELEGRGVEYAVRSREAYRGKRILIVGGGNSAFDWAHHLTPIAASLTLIHRRDGFRAHEHTIREVLTSTARVRVFHEVKAIHGSERVEAVTIFNNKTGEEERLEVDAVLLTLGFLANLGPITTWGLNIEKGSILVNTRMETNLPGVYAAGDVIDYPGKLALIATGFGDACVAVNHAKAYLDPKAKVFPGHSSEMK
jgi:ferredoxin/flavodoxin---NADP+ reductase